MNEILIEQSKYLVDKTLPNIANISNLIALLFHEMENINWLGFYICDEKNQECTLGPFQGKVACTRIPYGKGVVGTCASMIIGEDLKEAIANANLDCTVIPVESHGGFGEGDNTEGAIMVLDSAVEYGIIPREEADRQIEMLKKATEIEKTRGMAQGKYIQPNFGDNKEEVAKKIIKALRDNKKVAFVLNAKKETSYLFADILNFDYREINPENKPIIVANLDENIGLSRIRNHAVNIKQELKTDIDYITGGLDEYPVTGKAAADYLKENPVDLYVVCGVPHAFPVEEIEGESIAVTDGPRLVEPLKDLGYDNVVAELDAHSKTLGTDKIVFSDFGGMIRSAIDWK